LDGLVIKFDLNDLGIKFSDLRIMFCILPMGEVLQTQWSGFPVFIRRIDKGERKVLLELSKDDLRDKSDPWQKDEEILVLNAKCTHLGCIPNPNQGH